MYYILVYVIYIYIQTEKNSKEHWTVYPKFAIKLRKNGL